MAVSVEKIFYLPTTGGKLRMTLQLYLVAQFGRRNRVTQLYIPKTGWHTS
jgi:hypothetical protein